MGALSSEILHFLNLKLPCEMTRDGFFCYLGFQNFPGEDPHTPPPQTSPTLLRSLVEKWDIQLKEWKKGEGGSPSLICDLLPKDLLYPLSIIDGAEKVQKPVEISRKFNFNLRFIFIGISVETTFIMPKIVFIKI